MAYKHYPSPELKKQGAWGHGTLVTYPVSYAYNNGGVIIEGQWYDGVKVDPPVVPANHELVDIGVGLEFNCIPPLATKILRNRIAKENGL